jgi:NADPH:quinone reductase-like Zn-dependent oxidoreductase
MLLPKTNMVVWPEDTKPIDVACAQINPFTAIGLRKTAQNRGYNSVLLSAANSALSKMMIRYFNHGGMRVYGIVRKK